jgi:hypothetical protein
MFSNTILYINQSVYLVVKVFILDQQQLNPLHIQFRNEDQIAF